MNVSEQKHDSRFKASIPFIGNEKERFNSFLDSTGRKAGPYLRVIAIEEVEAWEAFQAGKT